MRELTKLAVQWYTPSECPFIRSTFLDIASLCGITMLERSGSVAILHVWEDFTSSVSISSEYVLGVSAAAGDALLRQSLAQIFFIDRIIIRNNSLGMMVSKEYQSIGDALMLLATEDQDTCCTVLDTLDKIIKLQPSNSLTVPLDLVVAHIHQVMLHATDAEVISKAQSVLANSLVNEILKANFFGLVTQEKVTTTLTKLETQCLGGPPSNMQSALHLLGFFLDFAYSAYPTQRRSILGATARYIRLLRMTIIDTNPFDTRFAAIQSLSALSHIFHANPKSKATGPLILGLSFILYDLLNDDDDEIRDAAALTTAKLLRCAPTVSILTSHHLATYLSTTFSTSPDLVHEATRRLTNTSSLSSSPFAQILAEARKEDTALFATEKQNLYKDDTLDAVFWSRVLSSLPTLFVASDLTTWVLDALAVLIQTAEKEGDGALGWSSKPEVFTLGIRVICAAEVVLHDRKVMVALRRFADVFEEREGHGLWVERIERVLERGVVQMLGSVRESLPLV
jgi:hypothetical protein